MGKKILYLALCTLLLITSNSQIVSANAQTENNSNAESDADYEKAIKKLQLSKKDEQFLLENEQEKELLQK